MERAKQERQQKIVQAEGEAEAAKMISFAMQMHFIFFTKMVSSCFLFLLCRQEVSEVWFSVILWFVCHVLQARTMVFDFTRDYN